MYKHYFLGYKSILESISRVLFSKVKYWEYGFPISFFQYACAPDLPPANSSLHINAFST